jgi:hypothetical protein
MKYEAGITHITWPYKPRWTGVYIIAESKLAAEKYFMSHGFYRNLILRVV